jgi:hypothetical protein
MFYLRRQNSPQPFLSGRQILLNDFIFDPEDGSRKFVEKTESSYKTEGCHIPSIPQYNKM